MDVFPLIEVIYSATERLNTKVGSGIVSHDAKTIQEPDIATLLTALQCLQSALRVPQATMIEIAKEYAKIVFVFESADIAAMIACSSVCLDDSFGTRNLRRMVGWR